MLAGEEKSNTGCTVVYITNSPPSVGREFEAEKASLKSDSRAMAFQSKIAYANPTKPHAYHVHELMWSIARASECLTEISKAPNA